MEASGTGRVMTTDRGTRRDRRSGAPRPARVRAVGGRVTAAPHLPLRGGDSSSAPHDVLIGGLAGCPFYVRHTRAVPRSRGGPPGGDSLRVRGGSSSLGAERDPLVHAQSGHGRTHRSPRRVARSRCIGVDDESARKRRPGPDTIPREGRGIVEPAEETHSEDDESDLPGVAAPSRRDAIQARARELAARAEAERRRHESVDVVFEVVDRDVETGGGIIAGALAYRLFIWLLPAVLVAVAGLGFAADAGREPSGGGEIGGAGRVS